jgi:hypothetical protein
MPDTFIGLDEPDTPNIDKKVRTRTRTQGPDTVHEEYTLQTDADNRFGSTAALAQAGTATLVSFTAPADYRLHGWIVTGDGDAYITIEIGASKKYADRLHITKKAANRILPVPDDVGGSLVELKVRNDSDGASDYEATVLGE